MEFVLFRDLVLSPLDIALIITWYLVLFLDYYVNTHTHTHARTEICLSKAFVCVRGL